MRLKQVVSLVERWRENDPAKGHSSKFGRAGIASNVWSLHHLSPLFVGAANRPAVAPDFGHQGRR